MCRHLAYVGAPVDVRPLLFDAPRALSRQAHHPRQQVWGDSNPDGWGVAWYEASSSVPRQYRTVVPIWDDGDFAQASRDLECTALVAAARLASPGAAIDVTGNAPFVDGRWSCSLNGIVDGFAEGVGDELRARLDPARRARLAGDADTEVLFALVLQLVERGTTPGDALATVVHDVLALTTGRLNLLLTDGRTVHATRVGNSLHRHGTLVASEPLDDRPGWAEIPDHTLLELTPDAVADTPL
jgi:glutamine amidotransferase